MEIFIDHERAALVFARLIGEYRRDGFPYTQANMARRPQNQVPEHLRGNANFWFYLCHLMRGMIKSDYAAGQIVRLHEMMPELFDPNHAITLNPDKINYRLRKVFSSVPTWQGYGEAWYRNSEILLAWGGNILDVYKGVRTETEVRKRIVNKLNYTLPLKERGFYMFQAKMASLLTYFLMDAGLIRSIRMSPPIDFHHMRAMVGTGILRVNGDTYGTRKVERMGDQVGRAYLDRFPRMHPVRFADLLFVLSREGCARAVTDPHADWEDPSTLGEYRRSCGQCPLEDKCDKTVSHKAYYTKGDDGPKSRKIVVVPRPRPPRRSR